MKKSHPTFFPDGTYNLIINSNVTTPITLNYDVVVLAAPIEFAAVTIKVSFFILSDHSLSCLLKKIFIFFFFFFVSRGLIYQRSLIENINIGL